MLTTIDTIKISENTKITENIAIDEDYENTEKNTVNKIDYKSNEVYLNFSSYIEIIPGVFISTSLDTHTHTHKHTYIHAKYQ